MGNSRLHLCEKMGLHAWLGECSIMWSAFLTLIQSKHSACKSEHIWAKVGSNMCISRDLIVNERCSFAVCLNWGTEVPWAYFRWCVWWFLWQIQIWATVNEVVCMHLEGRHMSCLHVGDKEHPWVWAGVSWSWNLYISQTSAAVNHLLKDFHGKNTWQPLKVRSGLTLCFFTPGHTSSLKCKFAESDFSPWILFDPCILSNFKH